MTAFPWAEAMSFGLGTLRLSPDEFWAMTPRELQAAMRGVLGPEPQKGSPTREEMNRLLARFPDER